MDLLKPYRKPVSLLVGLAVATSVLGLVLPKLMARNIDLFLHHSFVLSTLVIEFGSVVVLIFVFSYLQNTVQILTSERVARDLRQRLANKISQQNYLFIENITPAKLLTNITADVDSVKTFIATALSSIISSIILIIGASILLLTINWKLALIVLLIIPLIGVLFFLVFGKVKSLMKKSREAIDWLNKVINESIFGAALIRVLHAEKAEAEKFRAANEDAKQLGMQILKTFASMIPLVTFIANLATLAILAIGGSFIISGSMTLGDFAAFNSYIALLIFPIILVGVMSNMISQAAASFERMAEVLDVEEKPETGTRKDRLHGEIELKDVSLVYGERYALKDVSLRVEAQTKTAIVGPTAAGKTQLLNLLIGLIEPHFGSVLYDNFPMNAYHQDSLHEQIGFVFQDSIIFNLTLRENIAFRESVTDADLQKAIDTAELKDFIDALPDGLETVVSERGSSLSGGQRQRIMLARALALNPRILLLDDFTARVDAQTERKILQNLSMNYPDLTLVSVTQKIGDIETYDQIILLMEGEIIARGTHKQMLKQCPEYVQIFNSQKSTHAYE